MSELQLFFAVMAAFYVWECLCLFHSYGTAWVSWRGEQFAEARAFSVGGGRWGEVAMAPALPVSGTIFLSSEFPLMISPEGITTRDGTHRLVRFADRPGFACKRRQLWVNGQVFAHANSPSHARWMTARLTRIAQAPTRKRASLITEWLEQSLDATAIAARWKFFKEKDVLPSFTSGAVFALVFILAPILCWRYGLNLVWPWLLGGLSLLCLSNAILFFKAHKVLHPELSDERFAQFIMVMLFPPAGMRVRDMLSRPLLEQFHPVAVASELCPKQKFESAARRLLLELRYPRTTATSSDEAKAVQEWFHLAFLKQFEQLLQKKGVQPESLAAPPAKTDSESRSYCPLCHAQFTRKEGECSDCGIQLVSFSLGAVS